MILFIEGMERCNKQNQVKRRKWARNRSSLVTKKTSKNKREETPSSDNELNKNEVHHNEINENCKLQRDSRSKWWHIFL